MYDSSKAAGFYSEEEGEEELTGYDDFLACMEEAQALLEDEEVTDDEVTEAETACYGTSYRNTAMASFFFYDKIEAEGEVEI
jgi:hypothetical protein